MFGIKRDHFHSKFDSISEAIAEAPAELPVLHIHGKDEPFPMVDKLRIVDQVNTERPAGHPLVVPATLDQKGILSE